MNLRIFKGKITQKEKNMNNLYNIETELENLKKVVWNLTRNVIPELQAKIAELENKTTN